MRGGGLIELEVYIITSLDCFVFDITEAELAEKW